jgi:nucleotide-binding universal stress UspA family protein
VYRTILVPLDGSEFAEHALPTAAHLATAAKAPLLLARVHDLASRDGASWGDFFRNEEQAYLERTAARASPAQPIAVETALLEGDVVEAIRVSAEQRAPCLIVMSTNGRTGLSRAWLGSVADGVVRNSAQPVLMLRPNASPPASIASKIGRVLVALDGSSFAEQVVRHAAQLALLLPASMTLFRVIERPYALMAELPDGLDAVTAEGLKEDSEQTAMDYLEKIAAGVRRDHPAIDVRTEVRVASSAAPAIVERSCTGERALVALATRGRGVSRLLIGSVADKVIRAAGEGVLVIRPVS